MNTFAQFLFKQCILTQNQSAKMAADLNDHLDNRSIFKLADFFRSLTPSDCYDLALRLYLLWSKEPKCSPQQKKGLQILSNIFSKKLKQRAFRKLKSKPRDKSPAARSTSKYRSFNPDSEAKSPTSSSPINANIFHFLHNEAQRKQYKLMENERKKEEMETKGCSFQPNATMSKNSSLAKSSLDVFERLQHDVKKEKKVMNESKKFQLEMRGCTFTPTLSTKSLTSRGKESRREGSRNKTPSLDNSALDRTFERLYKEHQVKKQIQMENEFRKQRIEIKDCTFQPALTTRSHSSRGGDITDRFNRLYQMHSEKQRNVMMRRIEKEEEEERKFSFQPQIFSSPKRATSRDTSKDVHERLIEWNNDKKKKIEAKIQEKIEAENTMHNTLDLPTKKRNESMSRDETIDSIPAYQRLYKENESKKARKELLEKRVLREIGAFFAPKINQRNLSARKSPNNSNRTRYKSLIDNSPCNNYKANVSGAVDGNISYLLI